MIRREADAVVIGGGLAGLYAVLHLPSDWSVVVVDKGATRQSGSSPLAQGGIAAAIAADDSEDLHRADTIRAGAGACVEPAVDVLVRGVRDDIDNLLHLGCELDRDSAGSLDLHREAGQSVARSAHWADATGRELMRVVVEHARPRAQRLEATVTGLLVEDGRCAGATTLADDAAEVRGRVTMLASGGCGALYEATTNVRGATGDGIAAAYEAGAAVGGLEFMQFHPTALAVGGLQRVLLTEAIRGAGAHVVDGDGKRFLFEHHPDGELAPRDVVARAIVSRGGAFLDARAVDEVARRFPNVYTATRASGFDLVRDVVPVWPAAHFLLGGVVTDVDGRTTLPGLYAAGECAWTGVHGANRMAGNSLAESVVFGRRAALAMAREAPGHVIGDVRVVTYSGRRKGARPDESAWTVLRSAMSSGAGLIRTQASLSGALDVALQVVREAESPGLRLAAVTASLVCRSALLRTESRGVHYRADFPDRDARWQGAHTTLRPA